MGLCARIVVATVMIGVLVVAAGCGGGTDTPAGPHQWTVPEAIALPNAAVAAVGSEEHQQWLADWDDEANVPGNNAELQAELNRWCEAVQADRNDVAAQMGLSMAILAMSGHNGAQALGYNLFEETNVQRVTSLDLGGDLAPELLIGDTINTAMTGALPKLRGGPDGIHPAQSDEKQISAQDLLDWQSAISQHLLPAVRDVLERARAIADSADAATALVSYVDGEDATHTVHAADFEAMAVLMDLLHAPLSQLVAINVNYGNHNWDRSPVEMDTSGDGILTVNEYLPNAPFLNLNAALWTEAGASLRDAVTRAIHVIDNIPADENDVLRESLMDTDLTNLRQSLVEVGEMLAGEVMVSVELAEWEEPVPTEWTNQEIDNVRVNMRQLWDSPPASLRNLFPQLYLMLSDGEYSLPGFGLLGDELRIDLDDWNPGTAQAWYDFWQMSPDDDPPATAIGPAPHTIAFASGVGEVAVNLEFNAHWTTVTGTIGATPVNAALIDDPDDWEVMPLFKWADLPDRSFSGLFPVPTQIDPFFANWPDRYTITYGETVNIVVYSDDFDAWLP